MASYLKSLKSYLDTSKGVESILLTLPSVLKDVSEKGWSLGFKLPKSISAIQVSHDDIEKHENNKLFSCNSESIVTFSEGEKLFFDVSRLPYSRSDQYVKIQHFLDGKGNLYRIASRSIFDNEVRVVYYDLDLTEVDVIKRSFNKPPKKKQRRIDFVNNWMAKTAEELGLPKDAVPQKVHSSLSIKWGFEPTQKWYWGEWGKENSMLFPDTFSYKNFFTKDYKEIKFTKGVRHLPGVNNS